MKKTQLLVVTLLVLTTLLSACSPSGETVLTVGEKEYTTAALEKLPAAEVDYTNKDGKTTTFKGVRLTELLKDAGVVDAGETVVLQASDGYEAELPLEEALACVGCTLAFDDGLLRMVMPEMSSKLQVKDVVVISVK